MNALRDGAAKKKEHEEVTDVSLGSMFRSALTVLCVKMMDFMVKLTAENAKLKSEVKEYGMVRLASVLNHLFIAPLLTGFFFCVCQRHAQLLSENERLVKRLQEAQAHIAAQPSTHAAPHTGPVGSGLAALAANPSTKNSGSASVSGSSSPSNSVQSEVDKSKEEETGGINLHFWQLLLLAVVFFIVGRIFS